jgi:hypothetical protein
MIHLSKMCMVPLLRVMDEMELITVLKIWKFIMFTNLMHNFQFLKLHNTFGWIYKY